MQLLILVITILLLPDLDISVPPGTLFDRLYNHSSPVEIFRINTGNRSGNEKNSSQPTSTSKTRSQPVHPIETLSSDTIGSALNIPVGVEDFTGEMGLVLNMASLNHDTLAEKLDYETIISRRSRIGAFIKILEHMLIKYIHQNRTLDIHDTIALTLLGQPGGTFAATLPEISEQLNEFSKRTINYLSPDNSTPNLEKYGGTYEGMLKKLTVMELISFAPFSPEPFAPNLNNIPSDEINPIILELLGHSNRRVSRSALYYLGTKGKNEKMEPIFKILKATKDNVKKVRALYFLTKARHPRLGEYLLKRLKNETDRIFQVMIIDSLGRIKYQEAAATFINMLSKIRPGEFDLAYALLRATIKCLDLENDQQIKIFKNICLHLYNKLNSNQAFFIDPSNMILLPYTKRDSIYHDTPSYEHPSSVIPSYKPQARINTIRRMLEIAMAVTGNQFYNEIRAELVSISNNIHGFKMKTQPAEGIFSGKDTLTANFIIETAPLLNRGKSEAGKILLKNILESGNANETVMLHAIDTFSKYYTEELENTVIQMIKNDIYPTAIERALQNLLSSGQYGEKTIMTMEKIIKKKGAPDNTLLQQSIYYLGMLGRLEDTFLTKKIASELARANSNNNWKADIKQNTAWGAQLNKRNYMHIMGIQLLSDFKTKRAEEFLIKISNHKDIFTRRQVAKSLGSYSGENIVNVLLKMLSDEDGLVRLNAYLSLRQISGKESNADWIFCSQSELKENIEGYKRMILSGS